MATGGDPARGDATRSPTAVVGEDALLQAFRGYTRTLIGTYDIGEALSWLTDGVPTVFDVDGSQHEPDRLDPLSGDGAG